ncbi:MAG: hypothetical protein P4L71_20020 [Acetobacteraceae bacterium]|nr:hypothetical protein [Acetobacteraceae bacterium]
MATGLIDQCRQYVAAYGGYATIAASIGLSAVEVEEICAGIRPPNAIFASGMAGLIGVPGPLIFADSADNQFLTRHGAP